MRVLLIMPVNCDVIHSVSLPLGILSIATYLKEAGVEVEICDMAIKRVSLSKVLKRYQPDIVGLSFASTKSIDAMINVSRKLRKYNIPIVWGGPFCDLAATEHHFGTGLVDIISYREGEETWLELVRTLENGGNLESVKGIAFLKDGKIVKTEARPFMSSEKLPRIDYSFVEVRRYFQPLYGCKKLLYIYCSKGCPGQCTFCYNHMSHCHKRRRRPLSVFFEELEELVTVYGLDGFYLGDEIAFVSDRELEEFCDELDSLRLNVNFGFQTRIGALSREAIARSYRSGCRWIDFGIESGSPEILTKFQKNIPYDKIDYTFDACCDAGIISIANFIVGFPDETREQVQETIDLAKRIHSTQNTFGQYIPEPNTVDGMNPQRFKKKYATFSKLKDYKKNDLFNNPHNLSEVPKKELNVIQSHFLWTAIFRKDYFENRSYYLLINSIKIFLQRLATLNPYYAAKAVSEIVGDFVRFFIDEHFYPGIHKKYHLDR